MDATALLPRGALERRLRVYLWLMPKQLQGLAVILSIAVPLELSVSEVHGFPVQPHTENDSFPGLTYVRVTSPAVSGSNVYAQVQNSSLFDEPEPLDLVPSNLTARPDSFSRVDLFSPTSSHIKQEAFNSKVNVVLPSRRHSCRAFLVPGHTIRGQC